MKTLQKEPTKNRTATHSDYGSWACRRRPLLIWPSVFLALTLSALPEEARDGDVPPLRIAFSKSMFADVNENDALAAVKVWAKVLSQERELALKVEIIVLNGPEALRSAMRRKLADSIGLCSDEYWIQIGRQLTVIAASPALVPVVFCFRGDLSLPYLEELLGQIRTAHTTVAGQQALTIFQCDRLEERPASALQSAFDLLDAHSHLPAAAPDMKPVPLSSGAEETGAKNRTK